MLTPSGSDGDPTQMRHSVSDVPLPQGAKRAQLCDAKPWFILYTAVRPLQMIFIRRLFYRYCGPLSMCNTTCGIIFPQRIDFMRVCMDTKKKCGICSSFSVSLLHDQARSRKGHESSKCIYGHVILIPCLRQVSPAEERMGYFASAVPSSSSAVNGCSPMLNVSRQAGFGSMITLPRDASYCCPLVKGLHPPGHSLYDLYDAASPDIAQVRTGRKQRKSQGL